MASQYGDNGILGRGGLWHFLFNDGVRKAIASVRDSNVFNRFIFAIRDRSIQSRQASAKEATMKENKENGFFKNILIGLVIYLGYKGLAWINEAIEPLFFYAYNYEKFGWTSSLLRLTILFSLITLAFNIITLVVGNQTIKNLFKQKPKL